MKRISTALFCLALGGGVLRAQITPTNGAPTHPALLLQESALKARFDLLRELADTHRGRAEEAEKTSQLEKASWEKDLTKELVDLADRAASQLDDLNRQRLTPAGVSTNSPGEPANREEAAFLARVDTQLWRVEEEIKVAMENTKQYTAQLMTNSAPEHMLRVSFLAQENNNLLRFLERERADLELRKLQYRALKKP